MNKKNNEELNKMLTSIKNKQEKILLNIESNEQRGKQIVVEFEKFIDELIESDGKVMRWLYDMAEKNNSDLIDKLKLG